MKKLKYISLMLFVMVAQAVLAQKTVTGTVTEMIGDNSEPSIGVNVTFVNSQNRILTGTVTDFNGNYSLKVPEEKGQLTLVYSYIGMKTQRVKYTGQASQNVRLAKDDHVIKEVKVSGKRSRRNEMGLTQKQQSFATQKISMDEITAVSPVTSIEEALQGKLGGVDIIVGGDPGAKSNIRIRGTATLNGNSDPLIVVNGVPYSTDIDDSFDFNTANQEDFAQMLSLNPNDIESIEVLKDAASTAIYGTDGSNGVLLITTKKGATGKTRFSFSTKNTIGFEPTTIPMLNGDQYKAFIQDAIWNAANARGLSASPDLVEMLFDTPDIGYDTSYRYFDEYNQNVDWLDYITRNAFTTDNNFSMSGGGERATYRLSMSYLSQDGTTKGTSLTRLNTSIDVGYRFSEKLTVNTEYTYSDSEKKSPWADSDQLRSEALRKMPNKSPYYIDDVTGEMTDTYFTRQNTEDFQGAFNGSDKAPQNFHPIIMAKDSYKNLNTKEQKMTVNANWYILPELTFYGYVSMKYKTTKTESFLPQTATGVTTLSSYANQSSDYYTNNFSLQSQAKLIYAKDWMEKKHQLTLTGLWKTQQSRSSASTSTRYNVASS
ncbi:MAG: TonB-dependent receptor plug domain-containing protein, partial [Prevotella sp.]